MSRGGAGGDRPKRPGAVITSGWLPENRRVGALPRAKRTEDRRPGPSASGKTPMNRRKSALRRRAAPMQYRGIRGACVVATPNGPRAAQAPAAPAHRQAAPSGHSRGRRLHPSSPAQPPAGPDTRHLRMGRRTPQLDPARSHSGSERASSVARSSNGPVAAASPHATSACRACCTSSPSAAATAPTLGCWVANDLLAVDTRTAARAERRDLTEVIEDRPNAPRPSSPASCP